MSGDSNDARLSEEGRQKLLDEFVRRRSLRGAAAVVLSAIGIAFSAFQLWLVARGFRFAVPVPFLGEVQFVARRLGAVVPVLEAHVGQGTR